MKKKQLITTLILVFAIFLIGFFVRFDSVQLPGIPDSEKEFYEDQNGLPYMYELDSYYHYRLTKNFLDHGYIGDTKIDGRQWDTHSYYPPGVPIDYPLLIVYIAAFVYKFINLFTDVSLISICFWIPAFIGPLAGIIAYFFTRRFINQYGAAAAGILTVTSPLYVARTLPGYFDTDIFIILFPLLTIWFFTEAIQGRSMKMRIIFAVLSAFSIFVFSIAWSGWYYLFYIVFLFSLSYLIWQAARRNSIKNIGLVIAIFTIGSLLLTSILKGFSNIIELFTEPFLLIKTLGKSPWAPWPDVYSLVSELQKPSIKEVITEIGLAFFIGILGIIWLLRGLTNQELKKRLLIRVTWPFYSFLLFWMVASFIIFLGGGNRFALLTISPLVISAGIMIGILIEYPKLLRNSGKFDIVRKKKNLIKIISIAVLLFITIPSILSAHRLISSITPNVNDDLWNVSEWIENNTPEETVIISNWGYGHLYTAIADRSVSFDGRMGYMENLVRRENDTAFKYGARSPGTAREYWIDRALVTSNEALSNGILRMLSTTGDTAYLTLEDYKGSTVKSVEILNNILGLDRETAKNRLINDYHLTEKQSETLLDLTHPDTMTPFVFVTTNDIRDLASFIFRFGEWDFNKDEGYDQIYSIADFEIEMDILRSENGISMDMETGDIKWDEKQPYCVELVSKNNIEKHYIDDNSDFCVFVLMEDNKTVVMDKKFENSLFTKLFLEKSGNNYLKLIYENQSAAVWE